MGEPRAVLFEASIDGLDARLVDGTGDVLVVVFSQVRVPAGRFGLSRLFAAMRHAHLLLNQPANGWYRGCEAAIDAVVARALEIAPRRRVIFYGSSMGAFGAIAAAARHPEAAAIAYAPDFRIGDVSSQSARAGLSPEVGGRDLLDLLGQPRKGQVDLVIGLFDPYDAGVAVRLETAGLQPKVRLTTVASSHEIHDHLYSVNVVRKVIGSFRRPIPTEVAARGLVQPLIERWRYRRLAALSADFDAGQPVDPEEVAGLGLPSNPGAALLEAEALAALGQATAAVDRLMLIDAEIATAPRLSSLPKRYRKAIPRRILQLLDQAGDGARAAVVAADAARRFPEDAIFASRAGTKIDSDR